MRRRRSGGEEEVRVQSVHQMGEGGEDQGHQRGFFHAFFAKAAAGGAGDETSANWM